MGGGRGKLSRFASWTLLVDRGHLVVYREVGQGVTKKESSFGSGSKQTFELFAL